MWSGVRRSRHLLWFKTQAGNGSSVSSIWSSDSSFYAPGPRDVCTWSQSGGCTWSRGVPGPGVGGVPGPGGTWSLMYLCRRLPVADLGGASGPNSFNFMQFLGKFGKIVCWRPPQVLSPPPRGNPGSATVAYDVTTLPSLKNHLIYYTSTKIKIKKSLFSRNFTIFVVVVFYHIRFSYTC